MHGFLASSKFCRTHEAAALDSVARKVLVCVEEAELNGAAASLAQEEVLEFRQWRDGTTLLPFLRCVPCEQIDRG